MLKTPDVLLQPQKTFTVACQLVNMKTLPLETPYTANVKIIAFNNGLQSDINAIKLQNFYLREMYLLTHRFLWVSLLITSLFSL